MKNKTRKKNDTAVRVTLRLPESLWADVQHLAIDQRKSASALVAETLAAMVRKGGRV